MRACVTVFVVVFVSLLHFFLLLLFLFKSFNISKTEKPKWKTARVLEDVGEHATPERLFFYVYVCVPMF